MLLYLRGPDAADRLAGIAKYNFFFLQSIIYNFTNFSPSMVTYLRGNKAVDRKGGIGGYNYHHASNPFVDIHQQIIISNSIDDPSIRIDSTITISVAITIFVYLCVSVLKLSRWKKLMHNHQSSSSSS